MMKMAGSHTTPLVSGKQFQITNQNSTIQVNSLNINGLVKKLQKVSDFIATHEIDILLLQEIHLVNLQHTSKFFDQVGLTIHINKTKLQHNNYNGTAILYNTKIKGNYDIKSTIIQENRIQQLEMIDKDSKESITLFNIYLKSGSKTYHKKQRTSSLDLLEKQLRTVKDSKFYIGGDFNFITAEIDTNNPDSFGKSINLDKWKQMEKNFKIHDSRIWEESDKLS